jgi:hypothetical protein
VDEPIITIVQGETLQLRVRIRNKRTGDPYPLTGAVIMAEIKRTWASPTALKTLVIEPYDLDGGVYVCVLDEASSKEIPPGEHVFTSLIRLDGGSVIKRPRCRFHVLPG